MLFSSGDKKGDICLVLDLGNASLAGSLVFFSKDLPPEALFTVRVPFTITEHSHPEQLEATLLVQLHEVLDLIHVKGFQHDYFKKNSKKIEKVLVVCASPWYASKTKKVSIENSKPFLITQKFLEDVLVKETEVFTKELLEGSHGDEYKSGVIVMEKSIVDARINGYQIADPVGQMSIACDVTLYLGVHSSVITQAISEQILKFFAVNTHNILWHSFPLAAFTALKKIFPHEKEYILCDITGEVTELTLVVGGIISDTVSFPSGKFFLLRKIMQSLNLPAQVAQSFLQLWQNGNATTEMEGKIKNVLAEAEREWAIYLEDAFTSFAAIRQTKSLPSKMYLTADTDIAPVFIEFLKVPHTDTTMQWRKDATIIHLSADVLDHYYVSGKNLTFDECVALDSVFLSTFQ